MARAATVFISEFMTSGLWPDHELSQSLAREGMGMLLALVEDALHLNNQEVSTTWDVRLGAIPISHSKLRTIPVDSPQAAEEAIQQLLKTSDHSLFIAPEFHGLLQSRVEQVQATQSRLATFHRSLNCSANAVALCSDKLQLAEFLQAHQIPTITTSTIKFDDPHSLRPDWLPIVIKPRDGAGSQATFQINRFNDLDAIRIQNSAELAEFEFIQQPFVAGRTLSMAAIANPSTQTIQALPLCEQLISNDGRFHFEGSRTGAFQGTLLEQTAESLVRRCCQLIPGLSGYFGFDLIEPVDHPNEVLLVEINPRLTTSYLAYRKLADFNLAALLLDEPVSMRWRNDVAEIRIS